MSWIGRVITGLSVPGLMLGLFFFAASLTPSLIPRGPVVQGVLGGIVIAAGYLIAKCAVFLWRAADLPFARGRVRLTLNALIAIAVLAFTTWAVTSSLEWQNALRAKMGLDLAEAQYYATILPVTGLTFALLYAVGALLSVFYHWVRRRLLPFMPERRANILGLVLVVLVLFFVTRDGIFDRVVAWLDERYETAQQLFDVASPRPERPDQSGSSVSLIDWAEMGQPGRNFVLSGPDAEAIAAFTGRPALDPIRVYVGRANGETPRQRAELALAELKRLNAFEREVLVVTSPTGTGWMDPGSHDPLEYMHNGDIATVSAQYSFLQSPLALILETDAGLEQATVMLEVVHRHWKTLPADSRPRLYVHGLSLGAWSSMHATNIFRLLDDPIDGAFWAGPPFPSTFWRSIQNAREPDSPWVLPTIGDGSLVRYASHFADASEARAAWGRMRIVFLQYSSDPIVFYDPFSLWRAPPWMLDPPAPDVSEHLRFIPVVTQFQLALDMALSFGSPPGHGHAYFAQDYIAPWVEVTAPANWTRADTERLRAYCDLGFQRGCRD